jgi:GGDEF domain-containing protein
MGTPKDSLTGLNTEAYLRGELDNELARARRFGREVGLVLFEPVLPEEDRGDTSYTALKILARTLGEATRVIDEGVRWGHQVLVVLPETPCSGVEAVRDKIRSAFVAHPFRNATTGQVFHADLATAIAVYPHDGTEKSLLLEGLRARLLEAARDESLRDESLREPEAASASPAAEAPDAAVPAEPSSPPQQPAAG